MCFTLMICWAYLSTLYELAHLIFIIPLEVAYSDQTTQIYYYAHLPDDETDS